MGRSSRQLREAREAAGLTQEELAQRIGVHRQTVVAIEAGTPKTMRTIEAMLDVCCDADRSGEDGRIYTNLEALALHFNLDAIRLALEQSVADHHRSEEKRKNGNS